MTDKDREIETALESLTFPPDAPDFFDRFATSLDEEPQHGMSPTNVAPLRRKTPRWSAPAGGALVAAALAAVVGLQMTQTQTGIVAPTTDPQIALPQPDVTIVEPLLISDITSRSLENIRTLSGLSGVAHVVLADTDGNDENAASPLQSTVNFKVAGNGSYRQDYTVVGGAGGAGSSVYNATELTRTTISYGDSPNYATRITGYREPGSGWLQDVIQVDSFSTLLRQTATNGTSLKEVASQDRQAWHITVPLAERDIVAAPDSMTIVLDKELLLPLEVHQTRKGKAFLDATFTDYRLNPEFDAKAFTVSIPSGTRVEEIDRGLRAIPHDGAAQLSSYRPLTPKYVPTGFTLEATSFAKSGVPSGAELQNPPGRDVIWLTYRRGLESFSVSTRLTGSDRAAWTDPFGFEGLLENPQPVNLTAGAFTGDPAYLHPGPVPTPHLWAIGRKLVLTVSGDVTADEIKKISESIAP